MNSGRIKKITIYRVKIPFRFTFSHASADRAFTDNIVVQIELENETVGFGETIARKYVTGESPDTVIEDIKEIFVPIILRARPAGFGEVLEILENLPQKDSARSINAARCAIELALIDCYGKMFKRSPEHITGWLDQPYWEFPGSTEEISYSGIIGKVPPKKARMLAYIMRLWRLQDIKIKVGDDEEYERITAVLEVYAPLLESGSARIRVDANGRWEVSELEEKVEMLEELGIPYLEQPTAPEYDEEWKQIQHNSTVNIIADESLIDLDDAERLAREYTVGIFNIRVAKNGGLLPAMRLADFAYSKGIEVQIGCMVGELGILNCAGQWLLGLLPEVLFAEGNYNKILLKDDILQKPPSFKFAGKIPLPSGPGLGIDVDPRKLKKYKAAEPLSIIL